MRKKNDVLLADVRPLVWKPRACKKASWENLTIPFRICFFLKSIIKQTLDFMIGFCSLKEFLFFHSFPGQTRREKTKSVLQRCGWKSGIIYTFYNKIRRSMPPTFPSLVSLRRNLNNKRKVLGHNLNWFRRAPSRILSAAKCLCVGVMWTEENLYQRISRSLCGESVEHHRV